MTREETLKEISARMDRLGDLPVFSSTVNHICHVATDPDADAMELAQQVMKDTNLSTKLLRLANSSYYNRSLGRINVISRAVVLLGFNTIKNMSLTLKVIESFQYEHPGIDMDRMLVRSFIAANFVRGMALKCGVKDAEETYIITLLHNLGEITAAYFLPDKFVEVTELNKEGEHPARENEREVLGITFAGLGQALASAWEFPKKVIETMDNAIPRINGPIANPATLNHTLAVLSNDIVGKMFIEHQTDERDMKSLMNDFSLATGVKLQDVENQLTASYRMACDLAHEYGLTRRKLMPVMKDDGDETRGKLARQFAYYASSQPGVTNASVPAGTMAAAPATAGTANDMTPTGNNTTATAAATVVMNGAAAATPDMLQLANDRAQKQLEYIQEITSLIMSGAKLNLVLVKALEGIRIGVGFSRVLLCLMSGDRKSYSGRLAVGTDGERLKDFFSRPVNVDKDIFSRILMEGQEVLVHDINDKRWATLIPRNFDKEVGSKCFAVAALKVGPKPVGFIYADKADSNDPITAEDHRSFVQFVAQARLALQTCR